MALNVTNLFTDIGKLIKYVNTYATTQTDVATVRAAIEDRLETGAQLDKAANLPALAKALTGGISQFRTGLVQIIQARLLDRQTVLDELGVGSYSLPSALDALIKYLLANAESVDASVVTVGAVTAGSANVGNGTIVATKVLDGATAPVSGGQPCAAYAGVDSEFSVAETLLATCVADSYSNGLTTGTEQFLLSGEPAGALMDEPEGGSGQGPTLLVAGGNIVTGGDMETFSSNLPTGWTGVTGTAGAAPGYLQDTANFYRGAGALKLIGDASLAAIEIKLANTTMVPLRRYLVSFRYKASAAQTASQSLKVMFKGTGYTAPVGQKSEIAGDTLATSWTLVNFTVIVPANRPSDWNLSVALTGTPEAVKYVSIDDVIVQPFTWHNGIGLAAIPGATPFVKGDKFTSAIANNAAGTFQEFFTRFLKCQLPSNNAGAETILDTLAE